MKDKKISMTLLRHKIILQDIMTNVIKTVKWAEDYIKNAVKDLSYVFIVMADVSFVLSLLKNSIIAEAANQNELTYVIFQMWYCFAMKSLLLSEDMKLNLKIDLTECLVNLFKLIIEFQMQSIIWFYCSWIKNFFKEVINYNSWNKKLQNVKNSDAALILKFETAMSESSLQILRKLDQKTEILYRALKSLIIKMQEHIKISQDQLDVLQKINQHIIDFQIQMCLKNLQTTDSHHDKKCIKKTKDGLLVNLYHWVLYNNNFQQWCNNEQSSLLWVKRDSNKNKTMLLCDIINKLEKSITDTEILSFFFCQIINTCINSVTAVLCGLIYLLINRQLLLILHVQKKYDSVKKQIFKNANAWVILSEIFTSILNDSILQSIYLIIDVLNKCITDLSLLLDLVVQKLLTYLYIKWIISSCNWSSIKKNLYTATQKEKLCLELNKKSVFVAVITYIQFKID